jgi:integration host factor subunit beta
MTKSDLIERLCQDQKLPKGKAELLVNTIFDCLEKALARGERIEIRGFGSFEIREYKSYQGRNPKTGVPVSVKEKRLPFFKVGKELKERVNGGPEDPAPPSGNGHGQGRPPLSPPPAPATPGSDAAGDSSGAASAAGAHD